MSQLNRRTRSGSSKNLNILEGILSNPVPTLRIEKPSLSKRFLDSTIDDQRKQVRTRFKEKYPADEPKDLQINSVVSLANGDNTFFLAGTGYGKSRVPELLFNMFSKSQRAVVLVLNPLDALGNNQVLEKTRIGIKAINLTKTSFDKVELERLKTNYYSFIYLSPEIFLNSEAFQSLYHSKEFQRHLVLKVVDEAHCIYLWGLQASGRSRHFSKHVTPEDVGHFRPSYGNLGQQIMATDSVPLLLLSATCRPVAIESILFSLKLIPKQVTILQGELTRPELRIIRLYLTQPLDSARDLASLFSSATDSAHDKMTPTLIYSGSRNATATVSRVVCEARGTPDEAFNGNSGLIRRFHSVTGDSDQVTRVQDFADGKFPILSCTSALGMGQNWKRVKIVIVMGAMDPSESIQMGGRAGRDGAEGLVILLVQPNMTPVKNSSKDIKVDKKMDNEERMHALRTTPCCLRAAYSVDSLQGYIPICDTDEGYVQELKREIDQNMPSCRCSTCDPHGSARVLRLLSVTGLSDFDALLKESPTYPEDISIFNVPKTTRKRKFLSNIPIVCKYNDPIRLNIPMIDLAVSLVGNFEKLFKSYYPHGCHLLPAMLFSHDEAWEIVKNYKAVLEGAFLREILGSETIPGLFSMILVCIKQWCGSLVYVNYQQEIEDQQVEDDQNILDEELLEQEHVEELRRKKKMAEDKRAQIRKRREIREEKKIQNQKVKDDALEKRRNYLANTLS